MSNTQVLARRARNAMPASTANRQPCEVALCQSCNPEGPRRRKTARRKLTSQAEAPGDINYSQPLLAVDSNARQQLTRQSTQAGGTCSLTLLSRSEFDCKLSVKMQYFKLRNELNSSASTTAASTSSDARHSHAQKMRQAAASESLHNALAQTSSCRTVSSLISWTLNTARGIQAIVKCSLVRCHVHFKMTNDQQAAQNSSRKVIHRKRSAEMDLQANSQRKSLAEADSFHHAQASAVVMKMFQRVGMWISHNSQAHRLRPGRMLSEVTLSTHMTNSSQHPPHMNNNGIHNTC